MQKVHYSKAGVTVLHTHLASVQWSDLYPACQHLQSNKQMFCLFEQNRENSQREHNSLSQALLHILKETLA